MMNIFRPRQMRNPSSALRAAKSEVEEFVATARRNASSGQLSDVYRTSILAYTATNFWANNAASLPFDVLDPNGDKLDPNKSNHTLVQMVSSPKFAKMLHDSEVTYRFFGWSLSRKLRNIFETTRDVEWVNPNLVTPHKSYRGGLEYWSIMPGRGQTADIRYLYPEDAVFIVGFSFEDQFDGVSSAEVAFLDASTEPEIAMTRLSAFRNLALPALTVQPAVDQPPYEDDELDRTGDSLDEMQSFWQRLFKGSANTGRTHVSYLRWEYQQLGFPHKDLVLSEQRKDIQESIAQAFHVDSAFFTAGAANFAELEAKYKWWLKQWFKPHMVDYGNMLTAQLCEDEFPGYTIVPDFTDVIPEDTKGKLEEVRGKRDATLITLYQAQEEMGLSADDALKDLYVVEGIPIHRDQLKDYWRLKYPTAAAPMMSIAPVTEVTPADGDKALEPEIEPPAEGKALFIGFDLTDDPDLILLQNALQEMKDENGLPLQIDWNASDTFHLTLIFVGKATDEQIAHLTELMDGLTVPDLSLNVGSVNSFASPAGDYALHFLIRSNAALYEFQRQLYDLCVEAGVAVPTNSRPSEYTPHITMGRSDNKVRQTFKSKINITPAAMVLDIDKVEKLRIAPGEPVTPPDNTPQGDAPVTPDDAAKSTAFVSTEVYREIEVAIRKAAKGQTFTPVHLTPYTVTYIAGMQGMGIDSPMMLDAAKSHHLRVTAAKALSRTQSAFSDALVALFQKDIRKSVFISRMDVLLERYCRQAMIDGYTDGGIDDFDIDNPDDVDAVAALKWLDGHIADQKQYVKNVADVLFSDDSLSDEEIANNKPTLWLNKSVMPAYNYGLVDASGNTLGEFKQVKSTVDTCVDCVALRGQKRRMSVWYRYFDGDLPPSGKTFCQGFQCGDLIVPTNGSVSSGSLPRLHGGSKSEHHHEHELMEALP